MRTIKTYYRDENKVWRAIEDTEVSYEEQNDPPRVFVKLQTRRGKPWKLVISRFGVGFNQVDPVMIISLDPDAFTMGAI